MHKQLEISAIELAEYACETAESNGAYPLREELIGAFYGMAYRIVLSNDSSDERTAADELENALRLAKKSAMLLDACRRSRLLPEAFCNRCERKLASIRYRISKALKAAEERAGRSLRRLPPAKNIFLSRRLAVRTFLKSDIAALISLFSEPSYEECSLTNIRDEGELYRYLKTLPPFYAVTRKGSGELIGALGIFPDGKSASRVKIELGILPEYRGCGYFIELVERTSEIVFKHLGCNTCSVYLPKKRSYLSRCLLRIGFESEGTLRAYEADGDDTAVYSLVKTE